MPPFEAGRFSPITTLFNEGDRVFGEGRHNDGIALLRQAAQQQNALAALRLAEIYEHGVEGVIAPNIELALDYLQQAVTANINHGQTIDDIIAQSNPEQLFRLAGLYATGRRARANQPAVQRNYYYAFRCYQAAAERGYVAAYLPLAHHLREGKVVQQNVQQVRQYYERAYAALPNTTQGLIEKGKFHQEGWGLPKNMAEACRLYDQAFQQGDIKTGIVLAKIYENGTDGVGRDSARAASYYTQVRQRYVQQADVEAFIQLADFYMRGKGGVAKDFKQAAAYYQSAAALGLMTAYYLGLLNYNFDHFAQARELFNQAITQGEKAAHVHLGQMSAKGHGTQINAADALQHFENSDCVSNFELGNLCRLGELVRLGIRNFEINAQRAFEYYDRTLDEDDDNVIKAWVYLGNYYDQGEVVAQSYQTARAFYEQAVACGDEEALFRLGYYYELGLGGIRHLRMAFMCYQLAITNGHPDPQVFQRLGGLYEVGDVTLVQNFQQAVNLYQEGIRRHQASAYNSLGWLYCVGKGIRTDQTKSLQLFTDAVQRNCNDAYYSLCLSHLNGYGTSVNRSIAAQYAEDFIRNLGNAELLNLSSFYRSGVRVAVDGAFADLCLTASQGDIAAKGQVITIIRSRVAAPAIIKFGLLGQQALNEGVPLIPADRERQLIAIEGLLKIIENLQARVVSCCAFAKFTVADIRELKSLIINQVILDIELSEELREKIQNLNEVNDAYKELVLNTPDIHQVRVFLNQNQRTHLSAKLLAASSEAYEVKFEECLKENNQRLEAQCEAKLAAIDQKRIELEEQVRALRAEQCQIRQSNRPNEHIAAIEQLAPGMQGVARQVGNRLDQVEQRYKVSEQQSRQREQEIQAQFAELRAQMVSNAQQIHPVTINYYKVRYELEEREYIADRPLLREFYATLQSTLSGIIVLYKGLATNRLQGATSHFERILDKVCVAGEYLGCLAPGAGILTRLATDIARIFHGKKRNEKNQLASDNILNVSLMDRIMEAVARELTFCYEEQLLNLKDLEVSRIVGQAAALPILNWLLDPHRRKENDVLREKETVSNFVRLIQEYKIDARANMKRERKVLAKPIIIENVGKKAWTAKEFFTKPGFKTSKGEHFSSKDYEPEIYGWRFMRNPRLYGGSLNAKDTILEFFPKPDDEKLKRSGLRIQQPEHQGVIYEQRYKAMLDRHKAEVAAT